MRSSRAIQVVGCHAEGEIGDVITGGILPPPGDTVFEMMKAFERDQDHLRRFLICEPRGSVARHINLIVPAKTPGCAAGAIIMEPTEYPPMSGSNTICIATVLLETGMVPMVEPETTLKLDMPGGVVTVRATCQGGKVKSITLENVPSFVDRLDAPLEIEGVGTVPVDIAYGGMFYALVDATRLGFSIQPDEAKDLAILGEKVRKAARAQYNVVHPEIPGISGVSIVQFNTLFKGAGTAAANTCIVAPGRSDRSPTGTGLSARLAVLHARGQLKVGERFSHTSIIGSRFDGQILAEAKCGDRPAIIPAITGRAWITGTMTYLLDPDDPFPDGYVVSDTWGTSTEVTQG